MPEPTPAHRNADVATPDAAMASPAAIGAVRGASGRGAAVADAASARRARRGTPPGPAPSAVTICDSKYCA
jgi:hypothetical protein